MTKKIVVVDDDKDNNYSLKVRLEKMDPDYEIVCMGSGREFFDWLEKNENPDLVILDIMMPEMNGWEAFNKLKGTASWKDIPIMFLTARKDKIAEDAGTFLGEDFIEKPYDAEDLKYRIDKILQKK